jgi:hypothetical protein
LKKLMLVGATALMMIAVGATTASARLATDTSNKSVSKPCIEKTTGQQEGTFTWSGPTASWPPNHKDKAATITLTDSDEEPVTDHVLLAVAATHDEILADGTEMNGTGNTNPATDATGGEDTGSGSASVPVTWRSERSGRGDGRVYTFTATGTTDGPAEGLPSLSTCNPVTFTVAVPHDQSGTRKASKKRSLRLRSR